MKNLVLLIKPAAGLCNMNCGYCFYKSASEGRENRIMQEGTVDMLIERIKEFAPSSLSVMFQGGEPTLARLEFFERFTEKVSKNISAPVSFSLQTNGLLVDDAFSRFFKKNSFLLGVSLDGNRRTNDRYRLDKNGGGVLPQILNSISILKKHEVDFNILSVIDNENAADAENTYTYFKKHGFGFLQFIPYIDEGNGISLSDEKYGEFLRKIFDLWYEDYINGRYISIRHIDNYINILLGRPPESCAMCGTCGHYFVIEANGDIYPCDFYCRNEFKTGTVFDNNPFEINAKHREFIEESFVIHPHCKSCKYYILCRGGCKRDRINGFSQNKYCKAYYGFFEYAGERMKLIAQNL